MQKQLHGGDIYRNQVSYDFSANINPLGTPQGVVDAMAKSLYQVSNYPDIHCTKLVRALAKEEAVATDMLLCGNGAADLIFSLVQSIKPKRALVQSPTFMEYELALKSIDCEILYFKSKKENNYMVTEQILEQIDEKIDLLFLCNPNNPTGILIPPMLLEQIADKCKKEKVFMVLDECFQDFVASKDQFSMKKYLLENTYLFILKAFTKKYAMAGVRLGYGISGNKELLQKIEEVTQPWNVSIIAQEAGIAALKEGEYVEKSMEIISVQREFLKKEMKKLGVVVLDSKANYLFFQGPISLYESCLQEGMLIRDCGNYIGLEPGCYRVAVRGEEENKALLEVLKKYL